MPKKFEKVGYDEKGTPILPDIDGLIIEEGFYIDRTPLLSGLAYVSVDPKTSLWVVERHYEKPEDSAFLTEDNARNLERVVNSAGLIKQLKSELSFMKRKASEFFTQ